MSGKAYPLHRDAPLREVLAETSQTLRTPGEPVYEQGSHGTSLEGEFFGPRKNV